LIKPTIFLAMISPKKHPGGLPVCLSQTPGSKTWLLSPPVSPAALAVEPATKACCNSFASTLKKAEPLILLRR